MTKKSIAKNYIFNLMYQILTMIIPLITTPYLSRILGAENIGIYSYTLSICTYFTLFGSLGVAMYGQREIAYVQEKLEERSKIFFEIFLLRFITLFLSLIIFYLTFCLSGEYSVYYKILVLELLAYSIDISWYFQGLEQFKKTVIRNTVVKIVSVILIFSLVKSSDDLSKYFIIYVLSNFLGNLSLWIYLPKFIKKIKFKALNIRRHLKPTIVLFIPQIATQVYTVLDKTMIGIIISDKSEVGFYEQASKIVKLLMTLATSLGTVMMPRIAATFASGNKEKIKDYMNKSFAFILMISFPMMFGLISISSNFVPVFYGKGYNKVAVIIAIISPIIVAIGLSNVVGTQYLLPTKQQKKYTISVVVGAVVNFVLNLFLIYLFKSIGASIATVIAEFFVTATQLFLVRNEIKIRDIVKVSYKYVIASIIMFFCSLLVDYFIGNNFISIIVQVFISVVVYFSLLFIMKDKIIFEGINMIKNRKKAI